MCNWVMFGKIISTVGIPGVTKNVVLSLSDPIADPIKMHVNGVG